MHGNADGQGYQWAAGTAAGSTDLFTWRPTQSDTVAIASLLEPLLEGEVSVTGTVIDLQ